MSLHRKIVLVLFAILSIVVTGSAASIPHDEMTVRSTYSKLSMAFEINQLEPALMRNQRQMLDGNHLHVSISDIRTGPIQDILNTALEDLVTKPSGYVLDANLGIGVIQDNKLGRWKFLMLNAAGWKVAPYLAEDWHASFSELINSSGDPYTRYANFRVTLTFMGRQRSYLALFLFETGRDGKTQAFALDHIVGTSVLNGLLNAPMNDDVKALQHGFGDRAAVKRFLASVEPQEGCQVDNDSQLCCNSATGHCGVSELSPVAAAPDSIFLGGAPSPNSLSLQPNSSANETCSSGCSAFNTQYNESQAISAGASGTIEHTTGSHSGSVSFKGTCTYNGSGIPCIPYCHVTFASGPSASDTGAKTQLNFCHVVGATSFFNDGQDSCTASAGWGAASCQACKCGLNVTINGNGGVVTGSVSGGSGSVIWTSPVADHSWSCPTIN